MDSIPKATSATEWKSKSKDEWKSIAVEMPSGNTALLRRVGLEQFLLMGMIPNSLVTLMQTQIAMANGSVDDLDPNSISEEMSNMLDDPNKLVEIIDMVDRITIYCVLDPTVEEVPPGRTSRVEGALYVDEVDLEDKLFIFQWAVGGVEGLSPFREELAKNMGLVLSGTEVADEAESSS